MKKSLKWLTPWRISPGTGGCTGVLDPALPAEQANVIWRPEKLPDAVVLSKAPDGFQQTKALRQSILSKAVAITKAADGVHALLPWGQQLCQLDGDDEAPSAIVIPLDEDFLLRIAAAIRFNRMIALGSGEPTPEDARLTAQHRTRLIQMLRALDGRLSDATYREIASYIFGPGPAHEKGWKTHPVRAQTIRLVKDAIKIVNRGYLKLLRGR
jgi:hypothetical protein